MIIIHESDRDVAIPFRKLKAGDCFRYPRGSQFYMKLDGTTAERCVQLETGRVYDICDSTEVLPVCVEGVVKDDC